MLYTITLHSMLGIFLESRDSQQELIGNKRMNPIACFLEMRKSPEISLQKC